MLEAQKRMLVKKYFNIHAHSHKCERECKGGDLQRFQARIILEVGTLKCFKSLEQICSY
jgi:hypothetical protein